MKKRNNVDKFCKVIKALSKKYPDLRLGQLIGNLSYANDEDLFYLEDETILARFEYALKHSFIDLHTREDE